MTQMTQCKLRKGNQEQICFIPSKFAIEGKFLKIKDEDGWKVEEVFSSSSQEDLQMKHNERRDLKKRLK